MDIQGLSAGFFLQLDPNYHTALVLLFVDEGVDITVKVSNRLLKVFYLVNHDIQVIHVLKPQI